MSVCVPGDAACPFGSGVHSMPWIEVSPQSPHPPECYCTFPGSSAPQRPGRDRDGCDPASPGTSQEQGLQVGDPKARGLRLQ